MSLAWEDLEIGRELDLTLVPRKGVYGGSVKGTIQLLVGDPTTGVVEEEQGLALSATAASTISGLSASGVTVENEVRIV